MNIRRYLAQVGPNLCVSDNGSAFVDAWLLPACAKLGIRLVHSTPHRPQGRGKIERFFRTVREQFLVEVADTSVEDLTAAGLDHRTALLELNRLLTAWVETEYHRRAHSETGQRPLDRWEAGWSPAGTDTGDADGRRSDRGVSVVGVSDGHQDGDGRGQAAIDRLAEQFPNAIMVHTPVHASWLNQGEIFFSIVQRKILSPNDFTDTDEVAARLAAFETHYNRAAQPFKWKFTTADLADLLARLDRHERDHDQPDKTTAQARAA